LLANSSRAVLQSNKFHLRELRILSGAFLCDGHFPSHKKQETPFGCLP